MSQCGFQPADLYYAPCGREAGHSGPCAHPFADKHAAVDDVCLVAVGFRLKRYQNDEVLALSLPSPLCDSQWIQTTPLPGLFLLCRWSDSFDDDMPPDRFQVKAETREKLMDLLRLLAAPITQQGKPS
jgi:hypothetical protein